MRRKDCSFRRPLYMYKQFSLTKASCNTIQNYENANFLANAREYTYTPMRRTRQQFTNFCYSSCKQYGGRFLSNFRQR